MVQFGSLAAAAAALVGVMLTYFKFKPGERETMQVSVAEATLNIAKGTITMITAEMEDQFKRMSEEQAVLRADITQLRKEQRETQQQLDLVTREQDSLHRENEVLRNKVTALERRLDGYEKQNGRPTPEAGTRE